MLKFIPSKEIFYKFLSKRLENVDLDLNYITEILEKTLDVTYTRFKTIKNKYYHDGDNIILNTAHSSQMVLFLYELSRQAYLKSSSNKEYQLIADKLYYLKISDTLTNILYSIELPLKIFCDHLHSSVIGRATFSKNSSLTFSTNCNIGNNWNIYPNINGDLVMFPKSVLIGKVQIEGLVVLSAGCYIKDEGLIKNKLVFGRTPNLIFKDIKEEDKDKYSMFI
tara:strand:+ start:1654 stop:2322 length:669 start_codon:yes stop_codon:yes gene_type:complete